MSQYNPLNWSQPRKLACLGFLSLTTTVFFAGSAGSDSWSYYAWDKKSEFEERKVGLWTFTYTVQYDHDDDDKEQNDYGMSRMSIDDDFTNWKALRANRGTTLTAMILGFFPTVLYLYEAAFNKRIFKLEVASGVLWLLAGLIGFAGSAYYDNKVKNNTYIKDDDDFDEEIECHMGCDLEFIAAAMSIGCAGLMFLYSRVAAEKNYSSASTKPPASAPPPMNLEP